MLTDGVLTDVVPGFAEFAFGAQAMLKKIGLKMQAVNAAVVSLPLGDGLLYSLIEGKGRHEVQVVGHNDGLPEVPALAGIVVQQGLQQKVGDPRRSEGARGTFFGAQGNEVARALPNPSGDFVRQTTARWIIGGFGHERTISEGGWQGEVILRGKGV